MTSLDTARSELPPRPPRSPAVVRRTRRALAGALAVAAVGVGGTAIAMGSGPSSTTDVAVPSTELASVLEPAAPAMVGVDPVGPGSTPATPLAAVPADEEPAPDADGPELTTRGGVALPPEVAENVRTTFDALGSGDITALEAAYAPRVGSAPWSAVESILRQPAVRTGLQDALRTAPAPGSDVPYLYSASGFRVAVDEAGGVRFVRAPS